MEQLQVGVAKRCTSPKLGTILFGYPKQRPAQAIGDDLTVVAAAFAYGDTKAVVVSADICLVTEQTALEFREEISEKTGIPVDSVIFCTTHTHSGPDTNVQVSGWGSANMEYLDGILRPQSIQAAVDAVNAMRPALMGVASTESDVAANRREISPDGNVGLGQNPWGLVDKELTVVSFKDAETDEILLNIAHYGAHATASGANDEATRDWPGGMKDVLEREVGGIAMFLAGSIGETGPRCPNGKTTQSYQVARELGLRAGMDAVNAWRKIKEWRNAPVKITTGDVVVPYEPLPSKETAQEEIAKLGKFEDMTPYQQNEYFRWKRILDEYAAGEPKTAWVQKQGVLTIGPVAIVPFPFEMFLYTTLQLRQYSKFPYTLSVSCANGNKAYLPSEDQLVRGGYEVWQFNYYNTYKMVDQAATYLVTENMKILNKAHEA